MTLCIVGEIAGYYLKHFDLRFSQVLSDSEIRTWIENDALWKDVSESEKTAIADYIADGFTVALTNTESLGRLNIQLPETVQRLMVRVQSEKLSAALLQLLGKVKGNPSVEIAQYAASIGDQRFIDGIKAAIEAATYEGHKRDLQAALVKLKKYVK